ncbi:MAG TPA: MIP/aquaporin family protein [Pirellulales bacterium]|nr:MIP/aquaporin family protein [Pirellulales bacterium]
MAPSSHAVPRVVPLSSACLAEMIGTFFLVLFGCGVVHTSILTNAQSGLWQIAIVWGLGITLAIYVTGAISGAHINPAITCAFACWGKFPWSRVPAYIVSQVLGAVAAAAVLFYLFGPQLAAKEHEKHVVRGGPGSEITAMCYGEFFPNPGSMAGGSEPYISAEHEKIRGYVTAPMAFTAEMLGTLILALVVFALVDSRNRQAPAANLAPVFIGLTIAALISVIAPLTQACFNPARDFGPRLFSYFAGWGEIAIPWGKDWGWLTVYIIAPVCGAILGSGIYEKIVRPGLPAE